MKKTSMVLAVYFVIGFSCGLANAQVNNLNEPGSLLVFPLIDSIDFSTIVEITNTAEQDVWLWCWMITKEPGVKAKDFSIHLTRHETFWWQTNQPYQRIDADGEITQIMRFADRKGCMFCWAVYYWFWEIDWDFLKGSALLYNSNNGRAFQYNAIPHQGLAVVGDAQLNLNGVEYTMATSQVMFEGFAANFGSMGGSLAVSSLDIDMWWVWPRFDIDFDCWNQNEAAGTRRLYFDTFEHYDLAADLHLSYGEVFTPRFQCATVSAHPLWAVFYQYTGNMAIGSNVQQEPLTGAPATIVIPVHSLTGGGEKMK